MINFENVNKENEEWLQSDGSDLDFQNMTGMDIADVALEQKGENRVVKMRVKKMDKEVCVSVKPWHYSDITAVRNICDTVSRSLNS
jgi:hypothetical protein